MNAGTTPIRRAPVRGPGDRRRRLPVVIGAVGLLWQAGLAGCSQKHKPDLSHHNSYPVSTFAVAPILNFSGHGNFDPVQAADLLASELSQFRGLTVVPVNRVLAAMAADGRGQVESPAHALSIADAVGADAIIVAGVTEYDPYIPVVGLTLQVYMPHRQTLPTFDAVTASRQAQPNVSVESTDTQMPGGQVQRTYNGRHKETVQAVREYARPRTADGSEYGWQGYLKVQKSFWRFCCHDALVRLMDQNRRRTDLVAAADDAEMN